MRTIDRQLHEAVEDVNANKVKELLNRGADPNCLYTNGYSPLMHAVRAWKNTTEARIEITRMLLSHGADPTYIAQDNYQAILLANDIGVISLLIDAGVEINREIATKLMYEFNGSTELKNIFENIRIIETDWVDSVRQIYYRILDYSGNYLYHDVLEKAIPFLSSVTKELINYKSYEGVSTVPSKLEYEHTLYALNRINELLLLSFQETSTATNTISIITLDEYIEFWRRIGFDIVNERAFHPFFHEIYHVEQCEEANYCPEIIRVQWPCLMFGELMFSRGGVCIRSGSNIIDKKVAEKSTLYWSHRRNNRPYTDMSAGWGGNSQWSTSFRLDYWNQETLYYNINCNDRFMAEEDELSHHQRMEVLKHRCFVKQLEILDCYPYVYCASEKYK